MAFQKAVRKKAKARIGICGPAGSGKTMSALKIAFGLGGKVAVIDTEHGSAELYSHIGDYDVATLTPPYDPARYIALMHEAEKAGYSTIVLDSLSHAWAGEGGLLEFVDNRAASGNKFAAWRDATPKHNKLIDAILQSPCHVIATMRSKTEYILEMNDKGKSAPKKVGTAPVQREGMDYEFTIVFDVEQTKHVATVSKDRTDLFNGFCEVLSDKHGKKIADWLEGGEVDLIAIGRRIAAGLEGCKSLDDVERVAKDEADNINLFPADRKAKIEQAIAARKAEFQAAA